MADGRVIIEAILDTANVSKNVKGLGKELNGISWKNIAAGDEKAKALAGSFKSAGTACTLSLTAPMAAAGAAAFGVASDYDAAFSKIKATVFGAEEDFEDVFNAAKNVYENGWGESLDAVADAAIRVKQNFYDISSEGIETITETCLMLADTMDMDVNESIRGSQALINGFGLTVDEAMDLLVSGAQRGLDKSGELGDNLAEYGQLFYENGYSASEMFSFLEQGLSAGAYNLDKVNDLVKEFGIRMSDGSVKKACEDLGGDFERIYDEAQKAGLSNKDTFSALAKQISECSSEQEKATAVSAIWGSQGEDNGNWVIECLGRVEDSYGDVAGAAQQAGEAASDNFATKMETAMRKLQGSIEPLGQPLLNIAENVADAVQAFGEWFASIGEGGQTAILVIGGIVAAIGPLLSFIGMLINVIPVIGGVLTALTGPVGIVIGIIAVLVAAFVALWNSNEDFRNGVMTAWEAIVGFLGPIIEMIVSMVVGGFQNMLTTVSGILDAIGSVISGAWQVAQGIIETVVGFIVGLVTGDFSMMQEGISAIMSGIQSIISGIWNGIASFFEGVLNGIAGTFSSVFNGVLGTVSGIFGGIADVIRFMMGDSENIVSRALDAIAGFFAGVKLELPQIKLPHFSIQGQFSLNPPSIPHIAVEWYAKGGVFNGASVIGVGEAGPEAVVPLSGRNMQPFAEAIAANLGKGDSSGNITIVIERFVHTGSDVDDDALLERIAKKVRMRQRAGGIA